MSNSANSDIATARRLTVGMNVVLVVALLVLLAGAILNLELVVEATIALFGVAVVAYVAGHVLLYRRVAASSDAHVTRDNSVGAALRLIWVNLLLYGGFIVGGLTLAVTFGYV